MDNVVPDVIEWVDPNAPCLAPDVEGMTSPNVRRLLNMLVKQLPRGEAYLEVGTHRGATLISALLDHTTTTAYAIDNYSQFLDSGKTERAFQANMAKYQARIPKVRVSREDCWDFGKRKHLEKPIGLFFYDGWHSSAKGMERNTASSHARALTAFIRLCAREFIYVTDDWNWWPVQEGTWRGIDLIKPKSLSFYELPEKESKGGDNYWNGLGVFHIKQRKHVTLDDLKAYELEIVRRH